MVSLKALRLCAVIIAHDNPCCMAHTQVYMLEATCWATQRNGPTVQLTEFIAPTVSSVRDWLGY